MVFQIKGVFGFSGLMAASGRDKWSFSNQSFGITQNKLTRSRGQSFSSADVMTCGRGWLNANNWENFLDGTEYYRNSWGCCSNLWICQVRGKYDPPDISKYSLACQGCTLGEERTLKLSIIALRCEINPIQLHAKMDN